ncbi:hypothetical protein GW932_01600 [archaeon]|nr:hypothetical protein [archaeon]
MKKIYLNDLKKKVLVTEKHVRWDWAQSLDNSELVRYVFVVSGERETEKKI